MSDASRELEATGKAHVKTIKFAMALLLIGAFVLFLVQNLETVKLRFLGWEAELWLALPLMAAYVLGALTLRVVMRFLNNRRKERKAERKLASARRQGAQDAQEAQGSQR